MALGKGLNALIQPRSNSSSNEPLIDQSVAQAGILNVSVSDIVPNPHQPRQHFSHQALEDLIQSIKQYGIIQPLLVSKPVNGVYELIAGERRLRASRVAGLTTVPVIVRDVAELEKVELALIENIQRSDLNAMEKAEAYRKLLSEFGLNHDEAARKLGISRSGFSNTIRLLELPGDMQKALGDGKITEGHAKLLLGLASEAEQRKFFDLILTDALSVSRLAQAVSGKTKQVHKPVAHHNVQLKAWEEEVSLNLATKVKITPKTIEISYYSLEELSELVRKLSKRN